MTLQLQRRRLTAISLLGFIANNCYVAKGILTKSMYTIQAELDDETLLTKLEFEAAFTNADILSDAERSLGMRLLSQTKITLASLDRKIKSFHRASFSELSSWEPDDASLLRDEMQARLDFMEFALAPHKMLPSEVLAEIFVHCHGGNAVAFPIKDTKPPWVLCRVCWHWRNVALGEPRLWSRVLVDMPVCGVRELKTAERIIAHHGTAIIVRSDTDAGSSISAFDSLVIPHLPRLVDLDLSVPYGFFVRLLKILPEDFSSMESLQLTIQATSYTPNISADAAIFDKARRLYKLSISASQQETLAIILRVKFPWGQLTDLKLGSDMPLFPMTAHQILSECMSLEILSIDVAQGPWPSGHLKLRYLQSLTLNVHNISIFERLYVPILEELRISGTVPLPNYGLTEMVRRSACKLTVLDYDGEHMSYSTVALDEFFDLLLSLRSFSTFFLVIKHETLDRIACEGLLPNLETLQIRVDSPEAFVDLVVSRLPRVKGMPHQKFLREARGYVAPTSWSQSGSMDAEKETLQRLNEKWGTNHSLMDD